MKSYISPIFYVLAGALLCTLNVGAQRIRGTPGIDYPNYHTIPQTSFKCSDQKYIPGFYADLETDCQVFHFCFKHRQESFLCPTGTTFNQPILGCDSWYGSNCSLAPLYYVVNAGPGIENAGKNIPMLLKLRDRAPEAFASTLATTSVFEKISSLYESSTEHPIPSKETSEGNAVSETVADGRDGMNNSDANPPKAVGVENLAELKEILTSGEINPGAGHLVVEQSAIPEGTIKDSSFNEFNGEQDNQELIYDPVTDGYYMDNFQSDEEYQDELESQKSQFPNYYDYNGFNPNYQMMQDRGSEQFQDQYLGGQYGGEGNEYAEDPQEIIQFDESRIEYADEMPEFSKRLSQYGQVPKRTRRKPTYIVVEEESEIPVPTRHRQSIDSILEATEAPFTESISIDTLVEELSTEFPEESEFEENFEEVENGENENLSRDSEQSNDNFDSSSLESAGSESFEQEESDQANFDQKSSDGTNFQGEEQSEDVSSLNKDQSVSENISEDSDEEITILDDSDDPEIPDDLTRQNFAPDNSMQESAESFVIIPDETDSVPEASDTSFSVHTEDNVGEPENQNFQYVYPESSEIPPNADSDENIYVYDDNPANEQDSESIQSEMTEESYASDEIYADSDQSQEVQYSQYREPDYELGTDHDTQRYLPENYYQYMPGNQETMIPQNQDLNGMYQMPQGSIPVNPGAFEQYTNEGSYHAQENLYSYGIPGESQGYGYIQPGVDPSMGQGSYMNYPYNPQYGYQNPDGSMYQDFESQSSTSLPESDSTDLSDGSEIKYEGYPLPEWTNHAIDDSVATDSEQYESSNSQSFENIEESESTEIAAYEKENFQDTGEVDLTNLNGALVTESENPEQNDEAYYVFDDNEETDREVEEISEESLKETLDPGYKEDEIEELPSSNANEESIDKLSVEVIPSTQDISNEQKRSDKGDETVSSSEFASITTQGDNLETPLKTEHGTGAGTFQSENSNIADNWPTQMSKTDKPTFTSTIDHLAVNPAKLPPPRKDFKPQATQFPNSMVYPNSMDFGPYSFGPSMGQQFGMMDSSNSAPFTKADTIPDSTENLSKLSSLQEKVRSMKRGKFGMFKKYMSSIKNRKE